MSYEEYITNSIHQDAEFIDHIGSEIGAKKGNYDYVTLDAEVKIKTYDKDTNEAILTIDYIANIRNTNAPSYGTVKFKAKIDNKGNEPAKFTLIDIIQIEDDDGIYYQ